MFIRQMNEEKRTFDKDDDQIFEIAFVVIERKKNPIFLIHCIYLHAHT